jgi:nucleotide-binding universal stress UspA family protein
MAGLPAAPTVASMIFDRIVCGVDASPESAEAVRQANVLLARTGRMSLVGVADVAVAVHTGFGATAVSGQIEGEMRTALLAAEQAVAYGTSAFPRLVRGRPASGLLAAVREDEATLVAVGSHGQSRVAGMLLGSVATSVIHSAPCSVLVARAGAARWFPRRVVVGHDGSPQASTAAEVAAGLAGRFGSEVRTIAAGSDRDELALDGLQAAGLVEFDPRPPVDALVHASQEADLVVVGSRALRGVRALGSVGERVAHAAACSVLVVREPGLAA